MTRQTKCFIEFSDLIGWRFECKSCHISLELPLSDFRLGTLHECPQCKNHWAMVPAGPMAQSSFEPLFKKFVSMLEEFKQALGENSVLGFSVTLELRDMPPQK